MSPGRRVRAGALLFALGAAAPSPAQENLSPGEAAERLDGIEKRVQSAEDQLTLVEHSYVDRINSAAVESLEQRFGKAELYFLLQDYVAASVLLFDVVLSPQFKSSRHYFDGVYYLGESLFRQKDYLGAKQFLREVMEAGPGQLHFEDALGRYVDIAARTNDYRDLDRYADLSRRTDRLSSGVQYLLAKATYSRADLAPADRLTRAVAAFSAIPPGPHHLQALYFLGVCEVEMGNLPRALDTFQSAVRDDADADPNGGEIRELAWLAVGRIDYELGKYAEALDAYQEVPESSPAFYDALYEIAWTYVKKGDYEAASKAVDLILLGAPEGKLTPDANLLKGHLLLRQKKYAEAEEAYNSVINKYAPVRDEIDALLKIHADPAAYFEQLLASKGKAFDVATLLPPVAQQWATSQRDVAEAQDVVTELGQSSSGITEGRQIIERIQQRIASAGTMDAFPALQAGYARASAVDASLLAADRQLVALEQSLLGSQLSPAERQALAAAQAERAALQAKFDAMPKSAEEIDARRSHMVAQLDDLDKELFRLSLVIQSERAQLVAVRQMQIQTAASRHVEPADEAKFTEQVQSELLGLDDLDSHIAGLRRDLKDDETLAGGAGSAQDAQLRESYAAAVRREADLLARARGIGGEGAGEGQRIEGLRRRVDGLRRRASTALDAFRQAALSQAQIIRKKIDIESRNLDEYGGEVTSTQGSASGLVGRIAFASFRKVRQAFYGLVLKADVGIIDIAWTRKRDETDRIQQLATDEDRELRVLDDDFKEVLGEVK
ncbi:MAG: tetratricopeptide repeat protein [Myxococcales bacterium]